MQDTTKRVYEKEKKRKRSKQRKKASMSKEVSRFGFVLSPRIFRFRLGNFWFFRS